MSLETGFEVSKVHITSNEFSLPLKWKLLPVPQALCLSALLPTVILMDS